MKNNLFKLMTLLFSIGLFIASCNDVSLKQPELDTNAATDNATSNKATIDVFGAIDNGVNSLGKSVSVCPSVKLSNDSLIIDYGTTCPAGADGVVRTGKIIAKFTGFSGWLDGTSAVISLVNYTINGKPLTGTITVTCHIDASQVKSFEIVSTNMLLTFIDATTVSWNSSNTMSLVKTVGIDKYWSISGTSDGISRKELNFSSTATNLLTDPACKWFVGGTLTITQGSVVDALTFSDCGNVSIKHNNLPAIQVNLNTL